MWRNLVTDRVLVGQTGHTVGFKKRKAQYLKRLRKGVRPNKHFQRSWAKHTEKNFIMEVVELLPIKKMTRAEHSAALTESEQAWINYYKDLPGGVYNKNDPTDASRRGAVNSEETRRKLSEFMKGKPAWNKGVSPSAETRAKMSKAHKGIPRPRPRKEKPPKIKKERVQKPRPPLSEELRTQISEKLKGVPKSAEHRKNISDARTGEHHSDEARAKMSESAKNRPPMSEATKAKMSNTRKGRGWSEKRRAAYEASKLKSAA